MSQEIDLENGGASLWNPAVRWGAFSPKSVHRDVVLAAAAARDVAVARFDNQVFRLSHYGRSVLFHGHMPDTTTFVARNITNSKHQTKIFLNEAGVACPEGKTFDSKEMDAAWTYALSLGLPVVVKPLSGSGGQGVTSDIRSATHFDLAWRSVSMASRRVVEKHVCGADYRVLVVGGRFIAATLRIPASITGDGKSTINDLVARKNAERAPNPYVGAKPFKLTENMLRTIKEIRLDRDSVLEVGRTVELHPIANIGAGGDSVDVTHLVHPDFAEIAVRACWAVPGVFHAGVDLLVEDISRPASEQTYAVCEVNARPDIAMHHFPLKGPSRDAAGALIEALFPLARPVPHSRWMAKSISLTGRVTGVGLRNKIEHLAAENSLAGWVKNVAEGKVEAVLYGPEMAVTRAIATVSKRPSTKVSVAPFKDEPPRDFKIIR